MPAFSPSMRKELVALATADDFDLLDAMLILCEVVAPDADAEACRRELDEIAKELRGGVDAAADERDRLERFVTGMRGLGFRGNTEHYYDPRNSLLSDVLARRTGIPISLSVLFIEVGRRLGIDLRGIGFPLHFMVKAIDVPDCYLDPFFATTRDEGSCKELLAQMSGGTVEFRREYLRPVTGRQVFVRVLRNLKTIHKEKGSMHEALEYCELILTIDPEQPGEYRDRGSIYLALGEWNQAVDDLSTYLAITPDAPDRSVVLGQLQWMLHQQNSIH